MPTYTHLSSPVGRLLLVGSEQGLRGLYLGDHDRAPRPQPEWRRDDERFASVAAQLDAYFAGQLERFDVALDLVGTGFQRRVWEELQTIPHGETVTYGQLARRLGQPGASRAVGLANGRNPVSIIVPCHRVVAAGGRLGGYGWGPGTKRWLLDLEARRPQLALDA